MHQHALDRLDRFLRSRGLFAALLANPATVTWLSGYAAPINSGPSPFEGGPALGWYRDGALTLLVSDLEAAAARASGAEVREYLGYTIERPLDAIGNQAAALRALLQEQGGAGGAVGVEWSWLPAPLAAVVSDVLAGVATQRLDGELDPLRAVKSAEEIEKLRAALRLCDVGQAEVRANVRPGCSELELWTLAAGRMELAASARLPILADLVAGPERTAEIGGPPTPYVLQEGDPVIFDVAPRLDGYWGDTFGTWFVGTPTEELARAFDVVRAALRRGIEAVRPGLRARELDALLRGDLREAGYQPHPHHSGHGLGTTYHEAPRIVPYEETALQPGMVITVEPGVYLPGVGGVRLEEVVLVTEDGCEVLTRHLEGA